MPKIIQSLLLFIALSNISIASTQETAFLAERGLAGKSVEQMVDTIDQNPQARPLPYTASVTSTDLKLSANGETYTFPLGEKFYLSLAPYEYQTHPCFNHSLSGCQGEMPDSWFDVNVTDRNGTVLIHKKMKSYQNGFIGLWLPRNTEGMIEISHEGKKAAYSFKTANDSQTCLTDLQLRAAS
ncbi:TPA: copper-binding periplasmic metallochaperone CueP [Citrobacter koseri]|uniref:copper-binding periplasmic metallochaperone CueP n=1 Tax=Citrobacter koseri TaxID=545 RepID=UPI0029C27B35|nr:copper-binding periplasmic metallochaperone CueP [Citrobacter koseri]